MNKLNEIKKLMPTNIEDSLLISAVFDVSRKYDSSFVKELKKIKKDYGITIDSIERNKLRKAYYYNLPNKYNLKFYYSNEQLNEVLDDFIERLKNYDSDVILSSLMKRIDDAGSDRVKNNRIEWLNYYNDKRLRWKYSLIIIRIDQQLFDKIDRDFDKLTSFISNTYKDLENYRYLSIVVDSNIVDESNNDITWKIIYKLSVYAENFIQFDGSFFAFHKEKQIDKLKKFLDERKIKNSKKIAQDFYRNISCGYKFEDCYLSDDLKTKVLLFKKIELDESNVPCPSCMTTIQNGNSYPEMFLRSWECKNPECPDRSKSGRGKRFDEYGVYRYFKLSENREINIIDNDTYKKWHRDIFNCNVNYVEYLIKAYSWDNENICLVNFDAIDFENDRNIDYINSKIYFKSSGIKLNETPIYDLFNTLSKQINPNEFDGKYKIKNKIEIINGNSSICLGKLLPGQIGAAITSPPYYNAREYSQWENLIMYLIDMMINATSIFYTLSNDSYYLYNIGDIVSADNIYV